MFYLFTGALCASQKCLFVDFWWHIYCKVASSSPSRFESTCRHFQIVYEGEIWFFYCDLLEKSWFPWLTWVNMYSRLYDKGSRIEAPNSTSILTWTSLSSHKNIVMKPSWVDHHVNDFKSHYHSTGNWSDFFCHGKTANGKNFLFGNVICFNGKVFLPSRFSQTMFIS